MWSLVSRICPFLSQVICGGGSPWATQVKMAVVPTGLEMDWGCCTNSAGAAGKNEEKDEKNHDDLTSPWHKPRSLAFRKPHLPGNVGKGSPGALRARDTRLTHSTSSR